jgi:hypothetical protein
MNQARVKLPGSSDAGIKGELFDVLTEFFDSSSSWLEQLTIPILAGTTNYSLVPAKGGQIIRLVGVFDPNQVAQPAFMADFSTLQLINPPNLPQNYTVTVVKNVVLPTSRDAIPDAPEWVLRVYERYILAGLLGAMMGQMAKSYSNPQQSLYNLKRFRDGMAMARVATIRQNTVGAQAWSFPRQYRSGGQRGGVSIGNPTEF